MSKTYKTHIRHATIFNRLNTGQIVNVNELAEEFGVGVCTIQKDLNEFFPSLYEIEYLGNGNYRFPKGYHIQSSEDEEKRIALSLMKSLQHSAIPELDEYIDALLKLDSKYESLFLFDLEFESIPNIGTFKVLLQAINQKVGVEFVYTKSNNTAKEVMVHPYRIANFKSFWYLVAYDVDDERIKLYYLKNISKLHTLYENFIANEAIEKELERICSTIDSPWYEDEASFVTLKLEGAAKRYLGRLQPSYLSFVKQTQEYSLARMRYYHDIEVLQLVKRWLPDITIVDNPKLQQKLQKMLQEYLKVF